MGWDLLAYHDVDQYAIEDFIQTNNIDRHDWDNSDTICSFYAKTYLERAANVDLFYKWNENCQMHEIYEMFRTTYIRDDDRLTNRRFQAELARKVGRPFPHCLENINWTLRTRDDANEVARELRAFFPEDCGLTIFAKWLEQTAPHCSTYELSY